jgi:hypothetical protein
MPSDKQMYITPGDVTPTMNPATLSIANPALVEHLIHDQAEAINLLSAISPITIDDISIDSMGRVVIQNASFTNKMRAKLSAEAPRPPKNVGCGFFCAEGTDDVMLEA